jgi:hypothetical protein
MSTQISPNQGAADTPQPPSPTPEQFVEQLRALVAQIPALPSLSDAERKLVRSRGRLPEAEVLASVNVVGSSGRVSQAVGLPAQDVQQLVVDNVRWTSVESELKGALKAVADANLLRRQRTTIIAHQAYGIGLQLARDPENNAVVPHVEEMKRLKALRRRKATPANPAPTPNGSNDPTPKQ